VSSRTEFEGAIAEGWEALRKAYLSPKWTKIVPDLIVYVEPKVDYSPPSNSAIGDHLVSNYGPGTEAERAFIRVDPFWEE
jgi:hypothetical protein